jgi:hypothetical protein
MTMSRGEQNDRGVSHVEDKARVEREATALIRRGWPIAAIRRVRELNGWAWHKSKAYVEALVHAELVDWVSLASQVRRLVGQGRGDVAVKLVAAQAEMEGMEAWGHVDGCCRPASAGVPGVGLPSAAIPQVRALLAQERRDEAIQMVRELAGWEAGEARAYVALLASGQPRSTDYGSLSPEQLLAALEGSGRTPDVDLVRACLARREALTPHLLVTLAEGSDPAWDRDDPRVYRDLHAGLLLCTFREPAALPIFARIFRDEAREYTLAWFEQDFPAAYGPRAMLTLTALMNDDGAYTYARCVAVGMLTLIAQVHDERQACIVSALRALLPPLAPGGRLPPGTRRSELWTWLAASLADLGDADSLSQVQALYRAGMIEEWMIGDEQAYLDSFQWRGQGERYKFALLRTYEELHARAAQAIRRATGLKPQAS